MREWWDDVSHRLAAKTLIFLALLMALWWNQDRGIANLARETHDSLCAFRQDLASRQRDTENYIKDVEEGRRPIIQGITLAELRQSVANRQATLDSLSELDC